MADKDEAAPSEPSSDADLPPELTESEPIEGPDEDRTEPVDPDGSPAELETAGVGASRGSTAAANAGNASPGTARASASTARAIAQNPACAGGCAQ